MNIVLERFLGLGATYIISKREFSEKALRFYGSGWVWITVAVTKQRPPSDEVGFSTWLWQIVRNAPNGHGGEGEYKIVRTAVEGERRGWHPVWRGYVDGDHINTLKRYTEFRGIPTLPPSRDLFFKRPEERTRFKKRGKRF